MTTIECSWEEFKKMAKEFHQAVPTLNSEELDNAWKCLGIAYLGMYEQMWQCSAAHLLSMEFRTYMHRDIQLALEASKCH